MEKADRTFLTLTALLLVLEFVLLTATIVVLGAAIGWPASLDEPAGVNLPLITEERGAVILGYGSYLLYSILILPLALLLYRALGDRDGSSPSTLLAIAAGFGVASALARSLGILRWLVLMPVLAELYLEPGTGAATRRTISVLYEAFNAYAGGVGEILGVQLFGGLLFGLISVALVRSGRFPSWIGYAGIVVSVLLMAGLVELLGVDPGPLLIVNVTALQLWMLALAAVLLRAGRA